MPCGKRGSKLIARADAALGEDLPQVVGDGGGADEQLRGDLRVGGAFAGQAGDQRFLRGKGIWRLGSLLPGVPAVSRSRSNHVEFARMHYDGLIILSIPLLALVPIFRGGKWNWKVIGWSKALNAFFWFGWFFALLVGLVRLSGAG